MGLTEISEEQELLGILTRQSYQSPGLRTGLWLQSTGQFSEECLKNILHGVSVQHDTPTFHQSVLAGPAPRATTYHMHMREGAAPAVAGDSVAVWRDAVRSDEEACPSAVEGPALSLSKGRSETSKGVTRKRSTNLLITSS